MVEEEESPAAGDGMPQGLRNDDQNRSQEEFRGIVRNVRALWSLDRFPFGSEERRAHVELLCATFFGICLDTRELDPDTYASSFHDCSEIDVKFHRLSTTNDVIPSIIEWLMPFTR